MPGRSFNGNQYRYGMNTQEKDFEIAEGIYTAEHWEYDSRLGRRWNLDPEPTVGVSDYACFYDNPIQYSDPDGNKPGDGNGGEGDPPCVTCPPPAAPTVDKTSNSRQDNLVTPKVPELKPKNTNQAPQYYFQQDNRSEYTKEQDQMYTADVMGTGLRGGTVNLLNKFNPIRDGMDVVTFGFINPGKDSRGREMSLDAAKSKLLNVGLFLAPELSLIKGGKTFAQYKGMYGTSQTLGYVKTTNAAGKTVFQRISVEYHHVFITQRTQRALGLPNWAVNNSLNVWKLNTVQHAIIDKYRFQFMRAGMKPEIGFFKQYNWFSKFN